MRRQCCWPWTTLDDCGFPSRVGPSVPAWLGCGHTHCLWLHVGYGPKTSVGRSGGCRPTDRTPDRAVT